MKHINIQNITSLSKISTCFSASTPIPLKDIDIEDKRFVISYPVSIEKVLNAVKLTGLLYPVVLREADRKNRLHIVLGYKRVLSALKLGIKDIDAFIINYKEMTPLEGLLLSITDRIAAGELNHVEKAGCVKKLLYDHSVAEKDMLETYLPLLGIGQSKKMMRCYCSISEFSKDTKDYIVANNLTLSNCTALSRFPEKEMPFLIPFLKRLRLGTNRLKEILSLIEEIALRDHIDINRIVNCEEILDILAKDRLSISQKTERVINSLRNRRYPRLALLTENVRTSIKSLNLPEGIKLSHPPFFEGERWTASFSFGSESDFRLKAGALERLSKDNRLGKLILAVWENCDV